VTSKAICVEGLSKAYRLGVQEQRAETLAGATLDLFRSPLRNFRRLQRLDTFSTGADTDGLLWALQDVSFDVQQGEVVGFLGRNGAGKSTLLKVLSRIVEPTTGRVAINGRVSSLLEVGTGFHQELTGRENVYMNGTILGMKRAEIDARFDEIVAFSGVERFLDTPVKRYSSGMKVRLAFAVAAHLEPEILIIDEVLAVGDAEFQKKCLGKMENVAGQGRTVLFVSHNMAAIQNLCNRAVALRAGKLVDDGDTASVISTYLRPTLSEAGSIFSSENPDRYGTGAVRFLQVKVLDEEGVVSNQVESGKPYRLEIEYYVEKPVGGFHFSIAFVNTHGVSVFALNTKFYNVRLSNAEGGHTVTCLIERNCLAIGDYQVSIAAYYDDEVFDSIPDCISLNVPQSSFYPNGSLPASKNLVYVDHTWLTQQ
jgi:lipopolysaccharide transport system ATP-binding protein